MPNDKLSEAQAIYVSEIRKVQESADTWRDFLDFSAKVMVNKNQSEFEFSSKLIIHARNSKATDCRQFGEWKTNDGNHVNRYEKGIPVLSRDKSGKQSVTYLFDTSQTAFPKEPERVAIPDAHKDNFKSELNSVIDRLSDNVSFSDEQKRLFRETAEYKFCKQYQLDISENTERFSGIENLSVREIANIGIVLNRCGQELSAIIERNDLNEQEQSGNSKSREDRAELYGRERSGVDLGSGLSGTRNEVRVRRGTERVEQTQRGESDIRTADRDTRTETDSRDGQVRHSENEVHMADTVSDRSDNAERGYNETLRGNERESIGADGEYHREEETVGRVQGGTSLGQISSDTPVVGEIQERSGGRDTSGNSLRNIKDEAAEPEKVSAVSDLSADIPDEQPKEHSDGFENAKRSKNGDIILGNTTFRYIPEKTYTKISKDIAAEVADQLEKQGVKFSGVIKGDTATITVSKPQKEALDSIIASVSSPDNYVTLSQSEFIEIASNILSEDNKIFNAHRNSDEQNYRLEVNSGIDRIWTEAISNSRDIGYSVSEMSQLWESFQNDSSIKEHIQAVIAENVDITLTEREQQIEKTRQFAKEQGLPFSENYSKGADEEFNPYVADGSMSPEDYEKMHDLINADKSRPTVDDLSVGDVIRLAPDKENPERYGVVELSSEYRVEVGTYDPNDTAFCMKNGAISCNKNIFNKSYDFEYVGNVDELRKADHEQNKAIYEALGNHDIIHLTIADETAETFIAQNVQNSKIRDLRIEYNEFDDEKNDYDKGFVLKCDTEKVKDLILVSYGELSPEDMYLSLKLDKYDVSEIEKLNSKETEVSRQMSLFDDISDIEDFPDFIEEENIAPNIPEASLTEKAQNNKRTDLDVAKQLITDYLDREFGEPSDFSDISKISLAYTTDEEHDIPIQVYADLEQFRLIYEYDGNVVRNEQYNSLAEMNKNALSVLDFSDLVSLSDDEILSVIQAKSDEPLHSESEIKAPEKPQKFTITDYNLGEGGAKTKFKNNLLAIETLKQIENEDRRATPEEQEILSKYVGWGGLQEAFDEREASWRKEFNELKSLLTEEEYEAARSTVNDAFYTSPIITQAIYEGLSNIGFKGGEILEPSMGVGNFFGTMPDKMRENSNLAGIEIDSISGRIAQKLYPEADIAINGFEKIKLAKGSFDLAVGNVPFGNHGVNDKTKAYSGMLIHDYFFAKSLDSVRSGGVVAFITSTGTLDKEDIKVRQMLAQKAELMGAVRLPNNAFQKNAGTQTSTDIIFLKKREKPLNISDMPMDKSCDWVHTKENADGLKINSYFADNPDMVLGTLSDNGRFGSIVCTPIQGADLKEQLHNAMQHIKGEYVPLEFQQELDEKQTDLYLTATPDIENLTYTVVDDKLYYRVDDNLIPLKESEQHGVVAERRKAMCGMGKTVRELLQAQVEDRPDSEIKSLQAELTLKYDKFVKKFGRINPIETPNSKNASGISRKAQNSNAFKNDVRLPLLQSLEKLKDGQFIGKTEIFTERTIRPHKVAEHVETSHEALILSMSEKGRIDFDYMEQLTGFERNKIVDDLHGDIFPVPELSTENNTVYQTSDEYLSGNIYKKIAQAEAKISENPEYADNIAALTEVIPKPLKATEIDMQLGMTWIDTKIIQQFMYELFETPTRFKEYDSNVAQENPNAITVNYSGSGKGSWKIKNARLDNSLKSTKNFGTKDYNAYELLEKILNAKSVAVTETVSDPVTGSKKTIILEKETKAAEDKVKQINAAFKKWIFADPERRNELVKTYNEKFNGIRPREYDGSHLNFFGSNPEITLKPHQKNAVAHALFGGNTLFAHQVGAGKTFEMIATAMEGKRLGLHNKSMFVVPNHLTEQIGSDFMKLYPNANILVAKADDFSPQKRRQMCARIATGNFDAVIIGHSQLIKIPLSSKREEEFIRNQINEVMAALDAANETGSKSYTVKQLEAIKDKLRDRLEKLTNGTVKDNAVTFEELGVDKLFVDEAHEFKNLYVSTKMENVSGLSTNADVQKTQDLYMKCQYLDEKTNSKGVVFSTGTPVTNALSEMYTTMKYLQSDLLKETGLNSFDAWAGNFTRKSTEAEISPSGSDWRMKTRLKFTNVPELVTMFKECADIKMADQLNLDVPDCEKHIVSVEPTKVQKAVVEDLAERAERINQGAVSRSEDNMLVVTGDGRKLGLDQRLFDINFADEPQTKLNSCVQNVFDIWEKTAEKKSTQLVFCDLGVPQSKEDLKKNGERFDVYNDIRSKLIEKGIPEKEIAFIHDAASEVEKAKLFSKVRNGDVRVLIGSTQKMGAGTNVQDKLIALHDLDCPWRPADLTQRLGRMVRQGNENKKVDNFRYVTKGTFDAYLYQMVEKKQESIAQIFTSKAIARTCDDIDDMAVDFMQVKMAAIGDERIRRQMELREDIRSLNMLKNTYLENKYEIEDNINKLPDKIANIEKIIKNISDDTKTINNFQPKKDIDGKEVFEMKIGDTVYTDKKEAAEAFDKTMKIAVMGNPKGMTEIAEYKGFKIDVSYDGFCKRYYGNLNGANSYPIEFGSSESGNITRIDNTIASVPKRIDKVCNELERLKVELADSKKEINQPFEYESELEGKKQELERLTDEINADKVNGEIPPEQPESTSHSIQAAASEEQPEQSEKPKTLNIKWRQNDKELRISYDSSAENKITSFSDGKEVGHCSVDELTVSRISENEQKNYPADINKCVKPLNLAFSSKMAMHIRTFAEKVKTAEKDTDRSNTALFSREKIMSDDFKPTSGKNSDSLSLPEH